MLNKDKVTRMLRALATAHDLTEKAYLIAVNGDDDETRKHLSQLLRQYDSEITRIAEAHDAPLPWPKS